MKNDKDLKEEVFFNEMIDFCAKKRPSKFQKESETQINSSFDELCRSRLLSVSLISSLSQSLSKYSYSLIFGCNFVKNKTSVGQRSKTQLLVGASRTNLMQIQLAILAMEEMLVGFHAWRRCDSFFLYPDNLIVEKPPC